MKNQYHNLTEERRNELLKFWKKLRSCLMEHLVPGKQINYIPDKKI